MTTAYIIQRSLRTTYTHPRLWLLGILLSSGFSVHLWYAAALALEQETVRNLLALIFPEQPAARVVVVVLISAVLFLVFNYIKLLFFTQLHGVLHEKPWSDCPLCEVQKKDSPTIITQRIYLNTLVVSAIAIVITLTFSTVIKMIVQSGQAWSATLVMVILLGVVGMIIVSLWNLFSMLGILYTRLSLRRAMVVAVDFMSLKASQLAELVAALTVVFVVCMWFIGVMLRVLAVDESSVYAPFVLAPGMLEIVVIASAVISIVLAAWILIIQNVFFNMALTIFYLGHTGNLHIEQPLAEATPQV